MNINNELEDKLLKQPFAEELGRDADYRLTAIRYAQIENAIAVLSKDPGTVTVQVERKVSKPVPVDIRYSGMLPENFIISISTRVWRAL